MSKLIEKERRFYKECGVVMLETKDCTNIHKDKRANSYPKLQKPSLLGGIWKSDPNHYQSVQATRDGLQENFHLYITSDDEIKEGDWYLEPNVDIKPTQCKKISELTKNDKKIIATTDTSIGFTDHKISPVPNFCEFPQPSDKFIQAYIDAYNKSEKIEKVLVEYGLFCNTNKYPNIKTECNCPCTEEINCGITLKLKDNNIIIKKVKDSWSRAEVETSHLSMAVDIAKHILEGNSFTTFNPEKWIEKNL